MKITWIGHSCFKIEKDGYVLIMDPYEAGSVPGLRPVSEEADMVLCSHEHGDHNGRGEVRMRKEEKNGPFRIETLQTYHDEVRGAKRGPNKIVIIDDGTQRIAHLGDLGCDPEEEQKKALSGLDAVLVPVGGFYTIDGVQAAKLMKELNPRIVIPMHFRDDKAGFGYDVIGTVEEFTTHMDSVMMPGRETMDTEERFSKQVVVLKPARSGGQ